MHNSSAFEYINLFMCACISAFMHQFIIVVTRMLPSIVLNAQCAAF